MTKWRIWRRFMLLATAGALVWCLAAGVATWRMQHELARAQSEIGAGRVEPARRRLAALAASHPGALGGAVDYLLGVCEATGGRDEAALAAFARVPKGFEFASAGA